MRGIAIAAGHIDASTELQNIRCSSGVIAGLDPAIYPPSKNDGGVGQARA
jgi:hypothetical protein